MKKVLSSLLTASLLLGAPSGASAQEKLSIDKVYSVTLRNSGSIISNEQVKGYYFLYQSDKVDRHTNEYTLQLVDANLNKLKDIKFTDDKSIQLLESSYNGNSIMFVFYNEKEKTLTYRAYATDGNKSYEYSKILDKRSNKYFKTILEQSEGKDENENQTIFDVKNKGFLTITPLREDKTFTYELTYFSTDKRRQWTFNPVETDKINNANFLGTTDSLAVVEVISKENRTMNAVHSTILGIDLNTGRKVFESQTKDRLYSLLPMNLVPLRNSSNFLVLGPYYEGKNEVGEDKSSGIGIWEMTPQGKIVRSKYNSYERDFAKYLKMNKKGQVDKLGWIFFHSLMQTEDGRFFAVGEGYHKDGNAFGIMQAAFTGSYSGNLTALEITDMVMLELGTDFELKDAHVYAKNANSFSFRGADFVNAHTMALMAKAAGYFDYRYTQMGVNRSSFTSAWTDYVRTKSFKGVTFNTVSYADGKVSEDKIEIPTKSKVMSILPGKPGYVLIMEYFRKDKRLDVHLEKVN